MTARGQTVPRSLPYTAFFKETAAATTRWTGTPPALLIFVAFCVGSRGARGGILESVTVAPPIRRQARALFVIL